MAGNIKLGVNVDHVATLRRARETTYPDPVIAALMCEHAGCDSIVMHLRKDRRHARERDLLLAKQLLKVPLNLEMSSAPEILDFALELKPQVATIVPERRLELTTEGGLDVVKNYKKVKRAVDKLKKEKITVSLFIDPVGSQIKAAADIGADNIELHTGKFCNLSTKRAKKRELDKLSRAARAAKKMGFFVAAGHGLHYENVKDVARIKDIEELNIGHAIICRSFFLGLCDAVKEMIRIINFGS